jgi:hypothetical protein
LININKPNALKRLRKDLVADPVPAIRVKLIELAGEVGGPSELDWLVEKLGAPGESEPAWKAILTILGRSGAAITPEWVARIKSPPVAGKLTPDQQITFFSLVEQRARSENKADLLKEAQTSLAELYIASSNLKQASEYLKTLLSGASAGPEKQRLQGQMMRVYLGLGSVDQACATLSDYLNTKGVRLGPDSDVIRCIDEHLVNANPTAVAPADLLGALTKVKVGDSQMDKAWQLLLTGWSERYARARKLEENERANN